MKAKDHDRIVRQINEKHNAEMVALREKCNAAEVERIEAYWKQELADSQALYESLCQVSGKQDERIARLVAVLNIIKNDRRVPQEWFGPLLDAAIEDRQVERLEFPFGELDNGLHWKGE